MKGLEWSFRNLSKVDSTQKDAVELAMKGAPHGTVVTALEQTRGMGRHHRSWVSPLGGIYMSVILRPLSDNGLSLLPLLGALSVSDALSSNFALAPRLRWPNDVTIDGGKVAGVRADSGYRGRTLLYVVVGTGVNCNFNARNLGEASISSTTLLDVLRKKIDVKVLRQSILEEFADLYHEWESGKKDRVMKMVRSAMSTVGIRVRVEMLDGTILVGKATGMEDTGALIVRSDGGRVLLRVEEVERLTELGA